MIASRSFVHVCRTQKYGGNIIALAIEQELRRAGPSYPMAPLGPGPGPPSLRGAQTAHALFFHLVK